MRYFLKIKNEGQQIGVRRIANDSQIKETDALLQLISKAVRLPPDNFIVRFTRDSHKLRVLPGWLLDDYAIVSGSQLEVELLALSARDGSSVNRKTSEEMENRVENMNIVLKRKITEIKEEAEEEQMDAEGENEEDHIISTVNRAYEELLICIEKRQTEEFFKKLKAARPELGPCENQFYKCELIRILNQPGKKGWGALHFAVMAGVYQIIQFLLQEANVDPNMKTSDDWLPVQLALRQGDFKTLTLLLQCPTININICTGQGLPLILAVQTRNLQFVEALISKQVNLSMKDHLGRTVFDILNHITDPLTRKMHDLLKKEEQRQSISHLRTSEDGIFHALVSLYSGEVTCIRTPPRKSKLYYLVINPYEKRIQIFEDPTHYPKHPKQLVPMALVVYFKALTKPDLSWYMKSDKSYFAIKTTKDKWVFSCSFDVTTSRWVKAYQQAFNNASKYYANIEKFVKNYNVIVDKIEEQKIGTPGKKKVTDNDSFFSFLTKKCSYTDEPTCSPRTKQEEEQKPKKSQDAETEPPGHSNKNSTDSQNPKENSIHFSDFKIKKVLGEGSFGRVFLASYQRDPENEVEYALKCFKKKKLVINKQIKYIVAELNILKQLSHPFIVNLHFTFQTPNYVYLGLDYCPGKDLSFHLMQEVTFPEAQVRIYAAEILLALEYLHEKNIIYRDLKPENIMIGKDGHIKLVDFGLSKQGDRANFVAKSFCGSPAYLSPEMLVKKGVGKESDYYCLGAVIYEMLVGEPPYFSDDIQILYANITNSRLSFPKSVGSDARNLLTGLLERNPEKRLGYKNIEQIKSHSFFKSLNWQQVIEKRIKPPLRDSEDLMEDDQSPFIQILHQDFDYSSENYRVNRFINFSFLREQTADQCKP